MKKSIRFLALLAVILLVLLYLSTLVFALIDHPIADDCLKISVAATILLPVILYGFVIIHRLIQSTDSDDDERHDRT